MAEVSVLAACRFEEYKAGLCFVLKSRVEEFVHSPPSFLDHGIAPASHNVTAFGGGNRNSRRAWLRSSYTARFFSGLACLYGRLAPVRGKNLDEGQERQSYS